MKYRYVKEIEEGHDPAYFRFDCSDIPEDFGTVSGILNVPYEMWIGTRWELGNSNGFIWYMKDTDNTWYNEEITEKEFFLEVL